MNRNGEWAKEQRKKWRKARMSPRRWIRSKIRFFLALLLLLLLFITPVTAIHLHTVNKYLTTGNWCGYYGNALWCLHNIAVLCEWKIPGRRWWLYFQLNRLQSHLTHQSLRGCRFKHNYTFYQVIFSPLNSCFSPSSVPVRTLALWSLGKSFEMDKEIPDFQPTKMLKILSDIIWGLYHVSPFASIHLINVSEALLGKSLPNDSSLLAMKWLSCSRTISPPQKTITRECNLMTCTCGCRPTPVKDCCHGCVWSVLTGAASLLQKTITWSVICIYGRSLTPVKDCCHGGVWSVLTDAASPL